MSADFLQPLFDWISQHPGWAGLAVFLIAFSESLAIVGLFMPGVVLMFGIGTLVATGMMGFWPTFWLAVAGAIAGDGLSFWLGYHYKEQLRGYWPFNRYPELFGKGEQFFLKHGGKSILFGRFVGPVRPIVPVTAGMLGMGPWKFLSVNVLSALAWAPAYLLPGMVFGASLGLAAEVASRLAVMVVLLIAIPWLGIWLLNKVYRWLAPQAAERGEQLLNWGKQHPYLGQVTAALVDPQQAEARGLAILAVSLLAIASLILVIFQEFSVGPPLARLDSSLYHLAQGLRTPWGDHVMVAISQLGDGIVHSAIIITLLIWLMWRRHWLAAAHWLAMAAFALVSVWFLKQTLALPRPNAMYEGALSFSFPSAHTVFAACTFGFLASLIARELPQRWRWASYAVAILVILSIAFSRLYLGAHWLSDILGGLLLGVAWILVLAIAFRRHVSPPLPLNGLIGIPLATLLLFGTWHVLSSHGQQIERYSPRYQIEAVEKQAWLETQWQTLPGLRVDTLGGQVQPLNLQLAGAAEDLEQYLVEHGWQAPKPLSPITAIQWLNPKAQVTELPPLPHVHDGRHAYLTLIQPEDKLILRLWPADRVLENGEQTPLWLGYVSELGLRSFVVLQVPHLRNTSSAAIEEFVDDVAPLSPLARLRALTDLVPGWKGETLLIDIDNERSNEKSGL